MPFLQLTFDLGALDSASVEAACFAAGAFSVTLSDARDDAVLEPAPGEVRLWPATRVQALFPGEAEPTTITGAMAATLGLRPQSIDAHALPDRVWEREWLEHFHAMRFGRRLWVAPSHETVADPDAIVVQLDPGLAFGTGTHPTTAMCLTWLDAHLEAGARAIDYGCGSGILALAAAKLGAERVECFDIDPQALAAAEENAARNAVADRILVVQGASELTAEVDVLLANILSGPLCGLARRFAALVRPGGWVVLAGLLEGQAAEVTDAYRAWFDMRCFGARDEWVGLAGVRGPRAD
ncbi:MAG: 50S ribosomal protein L11 methyltransferase [Steroidobacteraceae bacterium]